MEASFQSYFLPLSPLSGLFLPPQPPFFEGFKTATNRGFVEHPSELHLLVLFIFLMPGGKVESGDHQKNTSGAAAAATEERDCSSAAREDEHPDRDGEQTVLVPSPKEAFPPSSMVVLGSCNQKTAQKVSPLAASHQPAFHLAPDAGYRG